MPGQVASTRRGSGPAFGVTNPVTRYGAVSTISTVDDGLSPSAATYEEDDGV